MATNNSNNNQFTNNADGFSLAGGTTARTLSLTAGNVSLSAGGSNTYTMPAATDTLVGRASTDTLTNKSISFSTNTLTLPMSGSATNYVSTDESTTSTTYTNLATTQSVTVTVGSSGQCFVFWSMGIYNVVAQMRASVDVSGASTIAASDNYSLRSDSATFVSVCSTGYMFTGLTPGSTTFTLKFKTSSGTARFFERRITAIPQ